MTEIARCPRCQKEHKALVDGSLCRACSMGGFCDSIDAQTQAEAARASACEFELEKAIKHITDLEAQCTDLHLHITNLHADARKQNVRIAELESRTNAQCPVCHRWHISMRTHETCLVCVLGGKVNELKAQAETYIDGLKARDEMIRKQSVALTELSGLVLDATPQV